MKPIKNNKIIQSKPIVQEVLIKESKKLSQIIENYNKGVIVESDFSLSISAEWIIMYFMIMNQEDKIFYKDNYEILRGQVTLLFSFDGNEAYDIRLNVIIHIFTISSLTKNNNTIKKTISLEL